ncbi:hypothetical protein DPMN_053183 [Dreissena polymorpha]|uniref:Uncharacterized protein n=1 Tax=Dreissena polymorpha TaxID=45954 RepID=A0A9D4CMU4_DREPO|nr:hypothetical protein DPMN_053183 [Dreissena polymorpha]
MEEGAGRAGDPAGKGETVEARARETPQGEATEHAQTARGEDERRARETKDQVSFPDILQSLNYA